MQTLLTHEEYLALLKSLRDFYATVERDITDEQLFSEFCHILGNISASTILVPDITLEQFKNLTIKLETDSQADDDEIDYSEILNKFCEKNWALLKNYMHNLNSCLLQGEKFELPLDMEFSESATEAGFDFASFAVGFIGAYIFLNQDFAEGKSEDHLYEAFVPMYYLAQIDIENEEELDEKDVDNIEDEQINIDENIYLEMCDNLEVIIEDIYKASNIA